MPRAARIDIPNLLQHVIVRGIERRMIFTDDDDRRQFVKRFFAWPGLKDRLLDVRR
jgi:putative transposase